jgi:DnaD/phage-associated family protein
MMRALDRAVANGFLLRVVASRDVQRMAFFALATAANRDLVERLRGNDPTAVDSLALPPHADLSIFRPTIFSLYEEHIGPLTPLVAERVRDAERLYPRSWIEEAIETAVHYNKRNWRYLEAILSRWEETGASHGVPGRNS